MLVILFQLYIFSWKHSAIQATDLVPALSLIETNFNLSIPCGLTDEVHRPYFQKSHKINYLLFTRINPDQPCDLQPTEKALRKCKTFNPDLKTVVLIHGWVDDLPPTDVKFVLKSKILQEDNYNVVVHNWTYYTQIQNPLIVGYSESSAATVKVGLKLSAWIKFLQSHKGAKPENFHLIGHSLGAVVASMAGKSICSLGMISFFDAAAPLFRFLPSHLRPSYTDADFVEAIHTSAAYVATEGYGFERPIADIDFYPNGGENQPKCYKSAEFLYTSGKVGTVNSQSTENSCNHDSVYDYYLYSFNRNCRFLGLICNNYKDYNSGVCNTNNAMQCEMGYFSKKIPGLPLHSECYFNTSARPPYCLCCASK